MGFRCASTGGQAKLTVWAAAGFYIGFGRDASLGADAPIVVVLRLEGPGNNSLVLELDDPAELDYLVRELLAIRAKAWPDAPPAQPDGVVKGAERP